MKLNQDAVDEFKEHLVYLMNDDVYNQLKDWLNHVDFEDEDDYHKIIDFFIDNLHGSLQWVDHK